MDYMTQEVKKCVFFISLEAFMVTNFNKIFSGRQPHQSVKIFQQTWLSAQDFNESKFYLAITVESRSIVSTSIVFPHVLFAIFGPELSSI